MSFKSLYAYRRSFDLAMEIFELSKTFPADERFALTNQIIRSSGVVCSAIAEAYRKREYPKYFANKLADTDSENTETQFWLDFAEACNYWSVKQKKF